MCIIEAFSRKVYVLLGIDAEENDRIIGIFNDFEAAKKQANLFRCDSEFYDIWMETHSVV